MWVCWQRDCSGLVLIISLSSALIYPPEVRIQNSAKTIDLSVIMPNFCFQLCKTSIIHTLLSTIKESNASRRLFRLAANCSNSQNALCFRLNPVLQNSESISMQKRRLFIFVCSKIYVLINGKKTGQWDEIWGQGQRWAGGNQPKCISLPVLKWLIYTVVSPWPFQSQNQKMPTFFHTASRAPVSEP